MAKLTTGQKAQRVLQFLLALSERRIAVALKVRGFKPSDLDEGWALLRALGYVDLDALPDPEEPAQDTLRAIDAWENEWFPIADATLGRRFPAARDWLFRNLAQTRGQQVVLGVAVLLERLDKMPKDEADGGLGAVGVAARELLSQRGLDAAVVAEARGLVQKLLSVPELSTASARQQEDAAREKAGLDLWAWYLEWSRIARQSITQRALLRKMGFLKPNGAPEDPDDAPPGG
jgi:hypothetical protein